MENCIERKKQGSSHGTFSLPNALNGFSGCGHLKTSLLSLEPWLIVTTYLLFITKSNLVMCLTAHTSKRQNMLPFSSKL